MIMTADAVAAIGMAERPAQDANTQTNLSGLKWRGCLASRSSGQRQRERTSIKGSNNYHLSLISLQLKATFECALRLRPMRVLAH